jgi:hypothetical protein
MYRYVQGLHKLRIHLPELGTKCNYNMCTIHRVKLTFALKNDELVLYVEEKLSSIYTIFTTIL